MLINILLGLIGLGLLVVIHEFGHFAAARLSGVTVEAFSVGWGPVLWSRSYGDTEYRLSAIPLGGYCKMKGNESLQQAISDKLPEVPQTPGSYYSAAWWKRAAILVAGPAANAVTALLFFWIVFGIGYSYPTYPNRIVVADTPDSPAVQAGLQTGDYLVSVDNSQTPNFEAIRSQIGSEAGKTMEITYVRSGITRHTRITPDLMRESGIGKIGIYPYIDPVIDPQAELPAFWESVGLQAGDRIISLQEKPVEHAVQFEQLLSEAATSDDPATLQLRVRRRNSGEQLTFTLKDIPAEPPARRIPWQGIIAESPQAGFFGSLPIAVAELLETFHLAFRGLAVLFQGVEVTNAVSGPVQITYLVGSVTAQGFAQGLATGITSALQFLAMISVILAFMNMLPIPALDGGQLLLVVVERLWPRPLSPLFIARYQNIGALVVLLLILFAVTSDFLFLFEG